MVEVAPPRALVWSRVVYAAAVVLAGAAAVVWSRPNLAVLAAVIAAFGLGAEGCRLVLRALGRQSVRAEADWRSESQPPGT